MTKEEDEGGRSYTNTMNVVDDDEECICSDDYNHMEDDGNTNLKHKSQAWGTWEELLLACAVKRHGFADWDSVATEVRSRTSISGLLASASNCRQKYRDLKRRFRDSAAGEMAAAAGDDEEEGIVGNIPWLEQLRSLRVAELRREVQQYDVSILSLQLKVKKLEEERAGDQKPDLEDEKKGEGSANGGSASEHREKAISTSAAAEEESERENRSMNESNSTASGEKMAGEEERVGGDEPSQTRDDSGDNNPDPVDKAEEGSEASQNSGELDESGTSRREWRRKRRKHSGDGSKNNHDGSNGDENKSAASKSQPLISLLDLIRSHPHGSLFERRLRSQETEDYKSYIKQHLDIETIDRKMKEGYYDSSSLSFYRDVHLLFTNAIVFFPSTSSESMAAHELRTVVSEEMRRETGRAGPKLICPEASAKGRRNKAGGETSDSSLSRQKPSGPLVACKKGSFVSGKASPSSSAFSEREETKEDTLSEERENVVNGVRSSRRASKGVAAAVASTKSSKKSKGKNKEKQMESNKTTTPSDKKKSMADFLKRLKNSPQKEKGSGNSKKESKSKPRELRSNNTGKKKVAEVETPPMKRAPGRPQKKPVEAVPKKRGREGGSTGKDNKQPKKRSKR